MTRHELLHRLATLPLALHPPALPLILGRLAQEDEDMGDPPEPPAEDEMIQGAIAVMPFKGIVLQHPGLYWDYPAVYTEWFGEQLLEFAHDDGIAGILIDADTPGGIIYGTPELGDLLYSLREKKPIHWLSNALSASAGYWIGTAAGKMYVTPSGEVGSVGAYIMHADFSKAMERLGVDISLIHAGEFKVEGNPYEPLSKEARAELQRYVDEGYAQFVADVARNRGREADEVLEHFGRGRTLTAKRALAAGMVDGIATLAEAATLVAAEAGIRESPQVASRGIPDDVEVRAFTGEARELDGAGGAWVLDGAVPYGQLSQDMGGWRETFEAGAFEHSIRNDDVRVLWQHDRRYVFGRVKSGTARVWEEDGAVRYTAEPPDAQWARDARESIRRGDVDQNSFAFSVPKGGARWERRDGYDLRIVSKARLVELGPQTLPAYTETSAAVREREAWQQREAPRAAQLDRVARQMALEADL